MNASNPPQVFAHGAHWLLVVIGALALIGCEKADNFRIRGSAALSLTNGDLVSLQRIAGAASLRDGRVWGIYATHAAKFED